MTGQAVSSLLRAKQAYFELLTEKHTLRWGVAFCNPARSNLSEAAQLREVVINDPARFSQAFDDVMDHFQERGTVCRRWVPAVDQPIDKLGGFLAEHGYRRRETAVLALTSWPDIPPTEGIRVLPARPMRQALHGTYEADAGDADSTHKAAAALDLLDDARMAMLVAMDGDRPVGRGAMFEVGDIGLVTDVWVSPTERRRSIGRALMAQIIATARQCGVRRVVTQLAADNAAGAALLARCGFVHGGTIHEFDLAAS